MKARFTEYITVVGFSIGVGGAISAQAWWWVAGGLVVLAVLGSAYVRKGE